MFKGLLSGLMLVMAFELFAGEPTLFQNDKLINLEISGDFNAIRKGKRESKSKRAYHPISIVHNDSTKDLSNAILAEAQVRGEYRLKNCKFPPLRIDLKKGANMDTSIFKNAKKVKMVTQCDNKKKSQWVHREYVIYKLYELLGSLSFKTKPANVIFRDRPESDFGNLNGSIYAQQFTFMLENVTQVGKRNGNLENLKIDEYNKSLVDPYELSKVLLFHYLIGNDDIEISKHDIRNVELYQDSITKKVYPVAYDFDFSMLVRKDGKIKYKSFIKQICNLDHELYKVRPIFIQNKTKIFNVVSETPYLNELEKANVKESFTEFYRRIEDDKTFNKIVRNSERCMEG